jgi:hypothetical protein
MSNSFIWWEEFILDVFIFIFKVREQTNLSLGWFLVSNWFQFFGCFEAIYKFMTVPIVFYWCFGLNMSWKKGFFDQNNLNRNFLATTVVRIWANQIMSHLIFFFKKFGPDDISSAPVSNKKKLRVWSCGS